MLTRSVLVVIVTISTLLVFFGAYVLYQKHVREEFQSEMQKCTVSDWLETHLDRYLSPPNIRLVGTFANVLVDLTKKQGGSQFFQNALAQSDLTTKQLNDVMWFVLRGVDEGSLIGLIRVCQSCLKTVLTEVPLLGMINGVPPMLQEVIGAKWLICVIDALRSSSWSISVEDVYTIYVTIIRNLHSNPDVVKDSDMAWFAYAGFLSRSDFETFVEKVYTDLAQVIYSGGTVSVSSVLLDALGVNEEEQME